MGILKKNNLNQFKNLKKINVKGGIYEYKYEENNEYIIFFTNNTADIFGDNDRANTALIVYVKINTYIYVNRYCIGVGNISIYK